MKKLALFATITFLWIAIFSMTIFIGRIIERNPLRINPALENNVSMTITDTRWGMMGHSATVTIHNNSEYWIRIDNLTVEALNGRNWRRLVLVNEFAILDTSLLLSPNESREVPRGFRPYETLTPGRYYRIRKEVVRYIGTPFLPPVPVPPGPPGSHVPRAPIIPHPTYTLDDIIHEIVAEFRWQAPFPWALH